MPHTLPDPSPAPFERAAGALSYFLWVPAGLWILYRGYVDKRRYVVAWFHLVQSTILATVAGGVVMFTYMAMMFGVSFFAVVGEPKGLDAAYWAMFIVPMGLGLAVYLSIALRGAVSALYGEIGPELPLVTDALRKVAADGARLGSGDPS